MRKKKRQRTVDKACLGGVADILSGISTSKREKAADEGHSGNPVDEALVQVQVESQVVHKHSGFWKGVKFSPDGLCVLANSDDDVVKLFNYPDLSQAVLTYQEGECVYDFAWFPGMDSANAVTCCFASTARGHPVHLWDAYNGSLRGTYAAYNHLDEVHSALSLCFNCGGSKLYAGVDRGIYVFDIARPGAQIDFHATSKTRKSKGGQRGIISSIAFDSSGSGLFVAGSYGGSLAVYNENDDSVVAGLWQAHRNGVTQVIFEGNDIYSGGRAGDDRILKWDMRKLNGEPVGEYHREARTNQRITFDVKDNVLVTASTCGKVRLYDTLSFRLLGVSKCLESSVNGVNFCPRKSNLFAVSTGERFFVNSGYDSEGEDQLVFRQDNNILAFCSYAR
mmetsp:Transcript_7340/g.11720  ORF Transcript_7340/g.11720 Transcript_7340/m.11720 type:complete len:393 (-) Transcript_7340:656-1834(-)|eukprot:CAMPEP_0203787608 /NCGR_PEP_ID=MMETSP0100_2-20121128/2341_1 /ASSEMBLY_ACC=CAM_ASM_000210 /TAXON_ID=96639 /ORGANISM=" , Strain NY0313808BC1" /LENGTH=392 /DNA_ID=CAMNT_0050690169 /DNA_START=92 /DNA_END=1270 /DNA_ORIENTATION=+